MKSKKHRQHKHVDMNQSKGLNVGGVVVPYWPSYWTGIGGGDVHHGQTTDVTQDGQATDGGVTSGDGSAAGAGITN